MTDLKNAYDSGVEIAWCPGCGNFAILKALKDALARLDLPPHRVLLCSGIGQAPKLPHYAHVNTFDGLHGREVSAATGAKIAAGDLTVIVHAGDGGAYGEGGNHFIHAIRRNIDITLIVHDNKYYGLTKGQASPTGEQGTAVGLQPGGIVSSPLNPLALAISQSCGFVAQGASHDADGLSALIVEAVRHRGFSLLNVLQPCVTWDRAHTYAYYRENCYRLDGEYDPFDRSRAFDLVTMDSEKIPLGVIYRQKRADWHEAASRGSRDQPRDRTVDPARVHELFGMFR